VAEKAQLVGLGTETPDMMGKLGQLLTLRNARAQAQMAEQDASQRKNIAAYDFNKHVSPDGTISVSSFANDPEAPVIFGDKYVDYLSHVAAAEQQSTAAKQTLMNLRTDQRKKLAEMVGGLRSDKDVAENSDVGKQKINNAFLQYQQVYGTKDTLPVLSAYGPMLQNSNDLSNSLKLIQLGAFDVESQLEAQKPQYAGAGNRLTNVNPNVAPGTAPDIGVSIPPGFSVVVDPRTNNPYLVNDQTGEVRDFGSGFPGGSVPPTTPHRPRQDASSIPAPFHPGEQDVVEKQANTNFENVTSNRAAASMAPQQLDQIDKALSLSKDVSTGAWAARRAQIESGIGSMIPGYQGMDDASKLQELDKFAERIATDASRVLGVNAKTDAERESIHKQNANIGYTPQAIQAVLSYAKAQTLAMQAKGDAQEAWLSSGNKITKQHEFETKFRQAYDPRVFQFEVMSSAEQEKFLKSLSKDERKTLREKTQALIELGAIPGG
jgi:hypothetical protein